MNATSGPYTKAHGAREPASGQLPKGGGTILDAIGSTALVMVDGIGAKLEFLNHSASIKARIDKYMIERAEREGLLRPGDTIVEASGGNTGNAMSMVAAVKGYRMLVVMPDGMSGERLAISRAFGAVVMTLGDFHVNDALAMYYSRGFPARGCAVAERYVLSGCCGYIRAPPFGRSWLPGRGGAWHPGTLLV